MELSEVTRARGLECARGIADWLCMVQARHGTDNPSAGTFPWAVEKGGQEHWANNWNLAFASMGLLAASKAFDEPIYEAAALRMGSYLKTLQIFDPFKPDDYGGIREMTPQTPWCFPRDALSAAWAFIELHRHTDDAEWLERARLWGEWFLKNGRDHEGWPLWGYEFEPQWEGQTRAMRPDLLGCFHGGSLNFLYHLGLATSDEKWTGEPLTTIANLLVEEIQQPDGYFLSIERETRKPPEADPQRGLHRANDDLSTLGLLCSYRATGDERYLRSIETFLRAVFGAQRDDGSFEDSVASIPVVINVLHEAGDLVDVPAATDQAVERALGVLYAAQSDGSRNPRMRGGLIEEGTYYVCARSSCYALIVLLKLFAGVGDFLRD